MLPGDFHHIALEREAFDVVVLGHVCRTEGDDGAAALVQRAFDALRPGGQVLIADYFADDRRTTQPFGVQMGLTMLANTARGRTVTHSQAVGWMRAAGFAHVRLMEPIGFNFVYVADRPNEPATHPTTEETSS